jgi:hypothetical protein
MSLFSFMQVAPELPSPLTHGFLLVEPAVTDHEPFLQTLAIRPCTPRVLAHREELMPRLIDLSSLDPDAQGQVGEMLLREVTALRPPVACAWLACDVDIDELALHVAQHLVGPGADGRPVFWRFYDPRVLALTLAVFDPAQRVALLGPVTDWQFAWAGHRWTVAGSGTPIPDGNGYVSALPKPDQWPRINRSEVATRVIDRLPAIPADKAAQLPYELDRIFTDAIHRGGMSDTDTLADYAWHCVRYGPAFEQHPILLDAWPALSRRETHWSDVLARFTPDELQALEVAPRQLHT